MEHAFLALVVKQQPGCLLPLHLHTQGYQKSSWSCSEAMLEFGLKYHHQNLYVVQIAEQPRTSIPSNGELISRTSVYGDSCTTSFATLIPPSSGVVGTSGEESSNSYPSLTPTFCTFSSRVLSTISFTFYLNLTKEGSTNWGTDSLSPLTLLYI